MRQERCILLSFDVEEFDIPLEYNQQIQMHEQMQAGYDGLLKVKEIISDYSISTTLFTTANFANHFPGIIKELSLTHEIASHTYYHSRFETVHLKESRLALEKITGKKVMGLRMPRMKNVVMKDVMEAGYRYDSSINPTWLPGRYNQLNKPRTKFMEDTILRIPATVSTFLRIPLFWLSFKNLPYSVYLKLVLYSLKKNGYVCLYFHPWEFIDLSNYKIPGYIKKPDGEILLRKFKRLMNYLTKEAPFITMQSFLEKYPDK